MCGEQRKRASLFVSVVTRKVTHSSEFSVSPWDETLSEEFKSAIPVIEVRLVSVVALQVQAVRGEELPYDKTIQPQTSSVESRRRVNGTTTPPTDD